MSASLLIPLGMFFSIAAGFILILLAFVGLRRDDIPNRRWPILVSIIGACLINSWWLALATIIFIKFVILQQDT